MKEKRPEKRLKVINTQSLTDDVIYQELLTDKGVFVERYQLSNKKPLAEIVMYVGLNILPSTKYFGHFPFNLCKETNANISVVYEIGSSGILCRHYRRFTQEEAEEQFFAGLEMVRDFKGKVIIFSHSASTIEHLKLIFSDKYKNFFENINISGGIISATVTNVLLELKKIWPNYKTFNWTNIMKISRFFNLPFPIYPYYSKARHAQYSSMSNLSIWINSKTSEFLLNTNMKKVILNGKNPDYPILVFIGKNDSLFNPKRQETLAKYMSKKAKVDIVKCDTEHNLFLSNSTHHIIETIKKYMEKVYHNKK